METQPYRRVLATLAIAAFGTAATQAQQVDPNGAPAPAAAEPPAGVAPQTGEQPEEIVVFGRNLELLGTAEAASEGSVGGADLLVRPMLKVAELLESVPGLVAVQHSGSGKANQYFLRGFNLDHGTDFTAVVDGMPWNLRSHGHGQGYLDINGMMPEVVERIDYRKGTYRADLGDFSMAGAAFITTIDRLDEPFVALEGGDYGWRRLAGGGTLELDDKATLTGMAEHKEYDGPWQQPEDLSHTALWGKYSRATEFGHLAITAWGYHATWIPTEQIPERAIGTAACANEFCALDPTSTGVTDRWITTAVLDGDKWRASAYAQYYDWKMQSDPDLRFSDQSVRPSLDHGRPLQPHRDPDDGARAQRRRRLPLRRHRQRRRRPLEPRAVRREHRAERDQGNLARRLRGGDLAADGQAARARRLARRPL